MERKIPVSAIQNMGFKWPKTSTLQKYAVIENGEVNVDQSLNKLQQDLAYYKNQITAAFNFKQQTGADYADFTDKFDDYVRMERALTQAINDLEQIIAAYSTDSLSKESS
jgi:hypothetical protein